MEIRKANPSDTEAIYEIIDLCKKFMKEKGEEQWPEHYPKINSVISDIKEGSLFVAEDKKIIGCVTIDTNQPLEYEGIKWGLDDKNPIIFHRLAVSPIEQRKGIAKELIKFAENFVLKKGFKSIRLDTYENNNSSNIFYQKRGYVLRGVILAPQFMLGKYNCYEKIL